MGYYINSDSKGRNLGLSKVNSLLKDGAILATGMEFIPDLVCVVDNGMFEAAAYCYSEQEYQEFANPSDRRQKTWMIYHHAKELSGYKH